MVVNAPDGYVNLRSGPGTNYQIITEVQNGETMAAYDETYDGKWIYVDFQGNMGWMAASQVDRR